jgi:hypothetical protein
VTLKRGYNGGYGVHWATSDFQLPNGQGFEGQFAIYDPMSQVANTRMLYECLVLGQKGNFISLEPLCEGRVTLRASGFIYIDQSTNGNTAPLYRCYIPGNGDHFISPSSNCEGQQTEGILGYYIVNPGVSDCYY